MSKPIRYYVDGKNIQQMEQDYGSTLQKLSTYDLATVYCKLALDVFNLAAEQADMDGIDDDMNFTDDAFFCYKLAADLPVNTKLLLTVAMADWLMQRDA